MSDRVRLIAIRNFRGPEGARGGEREGLVRKNTVFSAPAMRAAHLMRKRMAVLYRPVESAEVSKPRPKRNKRVEPESNKDAVEVVDELDSGSDVS